MGKEHSPQGARLARGGRTMLCFCRCLAAAASLVSAFSGCTNGDPDLFQGVMPPVGGQVSLANDVQPIFDTNCAISGCHRRETAQLSANLSLEAADIFDPAMGIVGVPSVEVPTLFRVMPFDSNRSYLINKVDGTQFDVMGGGGQMPLGMTPLDQATRQVIRDWIDQGAQDN